MSGNDAPPILVELQRRLHPADLLAILVSYGGGRWSLPTLRAYLRGERDAAILDGWRNGLSYAELSAQHGVSERTIRRIVHPRRNAA
jgi:Mor family transcriptional regulator